MMKRSFVTALTRGCVAALLSLFTLQTAPVHADTPISAAVSTFDENTINAFQVNGHAALSGSSLRLTPASNNRAGSAFWKYRVYLGDDRPFSSHFSFNISSPGGGGADGIVFTMQTASNTAGSAGGGIGYQGLDASVGIEFDTWRNTENGDPDLNHIGLLVNGSVNHSHNSPPAYVVSQSTLNGINTAFSNFSDGSDFFVWIDYDGNTLEVRLSRSADRTTSSLVMSRAIDLEDYLGQYAYIGFTAATGGANENHDIKTFYFNNDYLPGGITPDTVTYTQAPYRLTASAAPSQAAGGSNRTSLVTVTAYDVDGNILPSETITLSTDNGSVSPTSAVTNSNGQVETTVTFTSGVAVVSALATGGANAAASAFYDPPPTITTSTPTSVTSSSAVLGGAIPTSAYTLLERGVCYATTRNPTTLEFCTTQGATTGSFSSTVSLTSGLTYYVRAYATYSEIGSVYGNEVNVTIYSSRPTVSQATMSNVADVQATAAASILDNGSSAIISKGFYYGTARNPHLTGNGGTLVTDAVSGSSIDALITGLTAQTTYYIVPYATNSSGTSYGLEESFTSTAPSTPTPTPTVTPTATPTSTPTATPTVTPTATATPATTVTPGEIAGIIRDSGNNAVAGVVVYLYKEDSQASSHSYRTTARLASASEVIGVLSDITDENGRYSFTGLSVGDYRIVPNFTGMSFSPAVINLAVGTGGAAATTIVGSTEDLNDSGCVRSNRVTKILNADAKASRQLAYARTLITRYSATIERSRYTQAERNFLLGRLTRAGGELNAAFTLVLNTSEDLPKLTLRCSGRNDCTQVDLTSTLRAYRVYVNELRRLSFFVARRSRETLRGVRAPVDSRVAARIQSEHRRAVQAMRELPRQTTTCDS